MSGKFTISTLTQAASLVLDYRLRYRLQKGTDSLKKDVRRTLDGTYPLFRYLFPTARFLAAPLDELDRAGLFDGELNLSPKEDEWVRHAAMEYIRLQDEDILGRIDFSKIWEVVEARDDDENVDWLIERLKFRSSGDLRQAVHLSKLYSDALLEIGTGHDGMKEKLIDSLAERVGMKQKKLGPPRGDAELPFGMFEADGLVPNSNFEAAIAIFNGNSDKGHQLEAADRFVEAYRLYNIVFVLLGSNKDLEREVKEFVTRRRAVLLGDQELKRIGMSANAKETMRECILRQLPPSRVSPFQYKGPVTGDGFFGRRNELLQIAGMRNSALLGSRRIGKTSLLQSLKDRVNAHSLQRDTIAVFVDAGKDRHLHWFQKNLMQSIIDESELADLQVDWIKDGEAFFEELETTLRRSKRKFLFLIDEVDTLLHDPNVGLFEEFVRSMANASHARFVLSGYITLRRETENRASFLYNLLTPVVLGPLNRMDAGELVRTQMARIYVDIENEQVVEQILDRGTTFAAYVQRMCELLLKRLDEPMHPRCITLADVSAVYKSREFSEEIVKAVTVNVEEELGPLGRLILYWSANRDEDQFTVHELLDTMHWIKFNDALVALSYLTETYLLSEKDGKYTFYTPHLKLKLREAGGIDVALDHLIKEYRQG